MVYGAAIHARIRIRCGQIQQSAQRRGEQSRSGREAQSGQAHSLIQADRWQIWPVPGPLFSLLTLVPHLVPHPS